MIPKQSLRQRVETQLVTSLLTSPITYVPHYHFAVVADVLRGLCEKSTDGHRLMELSEINILEFDSLRGAVRDFSTKEVHDYYTDYNDLGQWMEYIVYPGSKPPTSGKDKPVVCLFWNLFETAQSLQVQTFLLNFAAAYRPAKGISLLIVDPLPASALPPGIRDVVTVVDIPRPDVDDVQVIVDSLPISSSCKGRQERLRKDLCRNLQGLELYEVEQIIRSSLLRSNGYINDNTSYYALEEKRRILQKSGIIELIPTNISFDDIGGLDRLRDDIRRAACLYRHIDEVEENNIPLPKGILLLGMPGCGKSMIAKATAHEFGVSLLRLDVSRLMGKYVGQSEANLRSALATAEAAHPCILWIDEIEKAFSGAGSGSGENDMLVMRMMGHFLTWMQERKAAVYIVATANDVLRSEFMRKGRFDQVYFVGFPGKKERLEILRKKLLPYRKSKHIALDSSLDESSPLLIEIAEKAMDRFAGAEIEYVVNEVMSRKLSKSISQTPEGAELRKATVYAVDFFPVTEEQRASIMNQEDEEKRQPSINNILKLRDTYHFPSASNE